MIKKLIKYILFFLVFQMKALEVHRGENFFNIYFDEKSSSCITYTIDKDVLTLYINKNFGSTEASVIEIHTFLIYILGLKNKSNEPILNLLIEEKKDVSKDDRTQKGLKNQLTKEEIKEILDFLRAEGFIIKEFWFEYIVTIFIITIIILAILLYLHKEFNIIRVKKLISNRSFII